MNAIEQLKSVLCDQEGKCCIRGSDADRAIVDRALEELTTPQQAEAVPPGFKLLKDSTHDERSWPEDYRHENGCYSNTCVNCLRNFTGYKSRAVCKVCAAPPQAEAVMVDMVPPATARDRWMYEQGRLAERDPRTQQAETHTAPQPLDDLQKDATDLLFALCDAWPYVHAHCTIKSKRDAIQRLIVKHGDFAEFWKDKQPQAAHRMADRLMGWKLPADFNPDGGIWFDRDGKNHSGQQHEWPTGTNLLTHEQAKAMFEYVLEGVL